MDITRITGNLPITRVSGLGGFSYFSTNYPHPNLHLNESGLKLFGTDSWVSYKILIGAPHLGDVNNKFATCIMTRAKDYMSRANLCLCVAPASFSNTSTSAGINNVRIEIKDDSFIEFNGNSGIAFPYRYFNGGDIYSSTNV